MVSSQNRRIIKENELDIEEFFRVIIERWKIILAFVAVFFCAGFLYVAIKTPIYKSSTRVIVADSASLAPLNQYGNYHISAEYAYYRFTEKVNSYQNFQSFVKETSPELGEVKDLNELFLEGMTYAESSDGDYKSLNIGYRYPATIQGAQILNDYIKWTAKKLKSELIYYFIQSNDLKIEELKSRRNLLKEKLVEAREAKLFDLKQAVKTADALNIIKPTMPQNLGDSLNENKQILYADIQGNSWQLPLYFMGSQVLNVEMKVIQQQLNEGLSSDEIRDLTQEITDRQNTSGRYAAILNAGEFERLEGIKAITIVDAAYRPTKPIAPNKVFVLSVALFAGFLTAILAIFLFRIARRKSVEL